MTNVIRTAPYARNHEFLRFGAFDAKGREIGACIERETISIADMPADHRGIFYRLSFAPIGGTIFSICVQKTLNGRGFGASQSTKFFATSEEAEAFAVKRIADSRKKARA